MQGRVIAPERLPGEARHRRTRREVRRAGGCAGRAPAGAQRASCPIAGSYATQGAREHRWAGVPDARTGRVGVAALSGDRARRVPGHLDDSHAPNA